MTQLISSDDAYYLGVLGLLPITKKVMENPEISSNTEIINESIDYAVIDTNIVIIQEPKLLVRNGVNDLLDGKYFQNNPLDGLDLALNWTEDRKLHEYFVRDRNQSVELQDIKGNPLNPLLIEGIYNLVNELSEIPTAKPVIVQGQILEEQLYRKDHPFPDSLKRLLSDTTKWNLTNNGHNLIFTDTWQPKPDSFIQSLFYANFLARYTNNVLKYEASQTSIPK